jgi:hypothetical protein
MDLPTFVNISIGLVFIYLILSLLTSEIQEMISSVLELRAKGLKKGIANLLEESADTHKITDLLYKHSLIQSLNQSSTKKPWQREASISIGPSYISAETFSSSLMEVLELHRLDLRYIEDKNSTITEADFEEKIKKQFDGYNIPESLQRNIVTLMWRARKNSTTLKIEIETWFDRSMERASGAYKRDAKLYAIMIGFLIALTSNADTLHIISRLSKEKAIGSAISSYVTEAKRLCTNKTPPDDTPSCFIDNKNLTSLSLPIGWEASDWNFKGSFIDILWNGVRKIIGWLLTGIAASMGSSFWFDLLNKFINIRNTGNKPKEANKSN